MIYYNNKLVSVAKELRKEMTKEEKHLWYDFLRHYPVKIYKQKVIDKFIVDFYCHSAKIVIEVDGSQHYTDEGKAYDSERTKELNGYGIDVIRFSNNDINKNFEGTCNEIDRIISERLGPSQSADADSSPTGRA